MLGFNRMGQNYTGKTAADTLSEKLQIYADSNNVEGRTLSHKNGMTISLLY